MLPAPARLRRREEFTLVVRRGRRAGRSTLVAHYLAPDPADGDLPATARAGFVVGRGVGGSVVRHRTVRRLRHLVHDRLALLPPGSRLVIRALPPAAEADYAELGRDLDAALARLGLAPRRSPDPALPPPSGDVPAGPAVTGPAVTGPAATGPAAPAPGSSPLLSAAPARGVPAGSAPAPGAAVTPGVPATAQSASRWGPAPGSSPVPGAPPAADVPAVGGTALRRDAAPGTRPGPAAAPLTALPAGVGR